MDVSERSVRLMSVSQRIDIRVTAWKQDAIERFGHRGYVLTIGDKADVYGNAARRFNRLTVMTR
jgi:hypothetical protein